MARRAGELQSILRTTGPSLSWDTAIRIIRKSIGRDRRSTSARRMAQDGPLSIVRPPHHPNRVEFQPRRLLPPPCDRSGRPDRALNLSTVANDLQSEAPPISRPRCAWPRRKSPPSQRPTAASRSRTHASIVAAAPKRARVIIVRRPIRSAPRRTCFPFAMVQTNFAELGNPDWY